MRERRRDFGGVSCVQKRRDRSVAWMMMIFFFVGACIVSITFGDVGDLCFHYVSLAFGVGCLWRMNQSTLFFASRSWLSLCMEVDR